MASIDLCIIDRGIQGTEWTAQNTGIQARIPYAIEIY